MKNAEKFLNEFGIYATELWAKPEKAFLEWLNADVPDTNVGDMIYRQTAIDAVNTMFAVTQTQKDMVEDCLEILDNLPSAQPERDIPMKPTETTDKAWGIPRRQAVCPKCDYYLGHVAFLGDYKGKRKTYCETCGQAIDWEGWEFDE